MLLALAFTLDHEGAGPWIALSADLGAPINLGALARQGLEFIGILAGAAIAAELLVAIVTGRLGGGGPSDRMASAARRFRRGGGLAQLTLLVPALLVALAAARGVMAGGARAVDASLEGLGLLWSLWMIRTLGTLGAILLIVGFFELLRARARLTRALHLTSEEARALAREHQRR
ncbi:MAG: hypothetical protein KC636_10380 [Myxococcales bacterium]|nr:hypothetical protein [Myxococcales bacterium]